MPVLAIQNGAKGESSAVVKERTGPHVLSHGSTFTNSLAERPYLLAPFCFARTIFVSNIRCRSSYVAFLLDLLTPQKKENINASTDEKKRDVEVSRHGRVEASKKKRRTKRTKHRRVNPSTQKKRKIHTLDASTSHQKGHHK